MESLIRVTSLEQQSRRVFMEHMALPLGHSELQSPHEPSLPPTPSISWYVAPERPGPRHLNFTLLEAVSSASLDDCLGCTFILNATM